jgi:hypothetical protein
MAFLFPNLAISKVQNTTAVFTLVGSVARDHTLLIVLSHFGI